MIANDVDLGQPERVSLIDGVAAGLRTLRDAGFDLVVVTNQAGVARGNFTEEDVDAVHQRIASLVDERAHRTGIIDRFYYCPYHPEGTVAEYRRDHLWRKPHPGMILQAARDMDIELPRSWMIGDQERDIQAGKAAGCKTVLVSRDAELIRRVEPFASAPDFQHAVKIILDHAGTPRERARAHAANHQTNAPKPLVLREIAPEAKTASATEGPSSGGDIAGLRRTMSELADEIRSDRMRRADFTIVKLLAGMCQLLALLLALLGMFQLSNTDIFMKWMIGAGLVQLLTITLLVLDLKG